jgi:hypothetical protein
MTHMLFALANESSVVAAVSAAESGIAGDTPATTAQFTRRVASQILVGASGHAAASARATTIPTETSKKRWSAMIQAAFERGMSTMMASVMLA